MEPPTLADAEHSAVSERCQCEKGVAAPEPLAMSHSDADQLADGATTAARRVATLSVYSQGSPVPSTPTTPYTSEPVGPQGA